MAVRLGDVGRWAAGGVSGSSCSRLAIGLAVVRRDTIAACVLGWISPGAVLAAVVGLLASIRIHQTAKFGKYNETYGSLGAIVG